METNTLQVKEMCEMVGVSRSGYYNWIHSEHAQERRNQMDLEAYALILEAYQLRGYNKGARGIHMRLLHKGVLMNVKKSAVS